MITPENKDKVLNCFISQGPSFTFAPMSEEIKLEIPAALLTLIINQFERKGLLTQREISGSRNYINLTADAYDFQSHGGFVAQEVLLQENLKKLLLEIEDLKPSMPEKIEKITSIIGGVSTFLSLILR